MMVKSTFEKVMPYIFAHEGGYVDLKADPGGATNYGITHRTLAAWRGRPVTKYDVRTISKREAAEIYRANYWNAIRGDDLPAGLDYCLFDFAINSGPSRAVRFLQRVVGVTADGKIGPVTLSAIRGRDPTRIIEDLCDARLAFLRGLKTWGTFGKGWASRVVRVRQQSMQLAETGLPSQPDDPGATPGDGRATGGLAAVIAAAMAGGAAWFADNGPALVFVVAVIAAGGLALMKRDDIKAWIKRRRD